MKILRLFNDWQQKKSREENNGYGGCGYYRVIKLAEQLSPEHDVTLWGNEWKKKYIELGSDNVKFYEHIFSTYDLVWMHYSDNDQLFKWMYVAAKKYGSKLVMDIDDNFLDLDEGNPAKSHIGRGSYKRTALATILSFCDAITVSTEPLKARLAKHFMDTHKIEKEIFVVPNFNDVEDWNKVEMPENPGKNGIVIGYMGSVSHKDDLEMVLPSIKTIMEKYPHVGFQLMGQLTFDGARDIFEDWDQKLRSRIHLISPTDNMKDFPQWFAIQYWDIGIAPLIDSSFNRCKSHIKWMEYAMRKIPTVASEVYPYCEPIHGRATIVHNETGFLCRPDEWVDTLSMLIEAPGLRDKIGQQAYDYVLDKWQYKDAKPEILDIVEKIAQIEKEE